MTLLLLFSDGSLITGGVESLLVAQEDITATILHVATATCLPLENIYSCYLNLALLLFFVYFSLNDCSIFSVTFFLMMSDLLADLLFPTANLTCLYFKHFLTHEQLT